MGTYFKNDDILSSKTFRDMTWEILEMGQLGLRQATTCVIQYIDSALPSYVVNAE